MSRGSLSSPVCIAPLLRPRDIAVPFRMQPGLVRSTRDDCLLTPLAPHSALHAEKRAVVQAQASHMQVPGFDASAVLATIAAHARGGFDVARDTGEQCLELCVEEDFAVIEADGGRIPWLRICVPSHWAPEEKIGLPLAAIHAPVADNDRLIRASSALAKLVCDGHYWQRHVWTISPSPRHDQHPRRSARQAWPQARGQAFAQRCWWRVERQSFLPVAGQAWSVFAIRVQLLPLVEVVAGPADAQRLHDALASMSEASLQYKGLAIARQALLHWLRGLH